MNRDQLELQNLLGSISPKWVKKHFSEARVSEGQPTIWCDRLTCTLNVFMSYNGKLNIRSFLCFLDMNETVKDVLKSTSVLTILCAVPGYRLSLDRDQVVPLVAQEQWEFMLMPLQNLIYERLMQKRDPKDRISFNDWWLNIRANIRRSDVVR